jgi:putative ABC transport system permease protein
MVFLPSREDLSFGEIVSVHRVSSKTRAICSTAHFGQDLHPPSSKECFMATKPVTSLARPVQTSTVLSLYELRSRQGSGGITGGATFDSAFDALRANRIRSFLTMLGVIIGVSAVIAVVTLTQGVSANVNAAFAGLGTNLLTIIPGTTTGGAARTAAGTNQTLTQGDAIAIGQLPDVVSSSPVISSNEQIVYQDLNWNTRVSGVYPSYQQINNWQIAEGSWFTDQAEQMGSPDAVVGQTVAENLFPTGVDPIGKTIRVGRALFHVTGTLQPKGTQGSQNSDDVIFVPFMAAYDHLNTTVYVSQIQVQVDTIKNINQVEFEIDTLLRTRHNLPGPDPNIQQILAGSKGRSLFGGSSGGGGKGGKGSKGNAGQQDNTAQQGQGTTSTTNDPPDDFQIFNVESVIESAQQSSAILTILLIGIAAISLSVGGIGIMNIMLVSVTERTREIGLRMAVGARRRDIRNQFLVEAVILSAAGGIVGIIIGLAGGYLLTAGLKLPFVLSSIPPLIAFSVSSAVGVVFGLYPATRAAKLDPVVALRIE